MTSAGQTKPIQIRYTDLDVNEHVNNVKYLDCILAGFTFDFLKAHTLREVEINYLSEAKYDDSIAVGYEKKENLTFLHSLLRVKDHIELCRARTCWEVDNQNV